MFGFGGKKESVGVAQTFVEATDGGWRDEDIPDVVAGSGGKNADYVGEVLQKASEYAQANGVGVGEEFAFRITDIPRDIRSPHEIIFPLMMRASDYGLMPGAMHDETAHFIRMK